MRLSSESIYLDSDEIIYTSFSKWLIILVHDTHFPNYGNSAFQIYFQWTKT